VPETLARTLETAKASDARIEWFMGDLLRRVASLPEERRPMSFLQAN